MTPQQRKALEELAAKDPTALVASIKPACGRRVQVVDDRIFKLEGGWFWPIGPGLRDKMEGCIINEMDPFSESVFRFTTARQALAMEDHEESRQQGGTRAGTLPERVPRGPSSGVEDLIAREVAKAMAKQTADLEVKLAAAREVGAAAERARLKAEAKPKRRTRRPSQPKAEPPSVEAEQPGPAGDEPPVEPATPPAE